MPSPVRLLASVLLLSLVALAACNGDQGAQEQEPGQEPENGQAGGQVDVAGVDYAFEGVPSTVEAGAELRFRNDSDDEAHEMVIFRIADDEERDIEELLQLPEEEAMQSVEFIAVAFALPGEQPVYPAGPTVVQQPGRYALVCFIPVGADPAVIAEAMQEGEADEPPDLGEGPPHFTEGMYEEFEVS